MLRFRAISGDTDHWLSHAAGSIGAFQAFLIDGSASLDLGLIL